MAQSLVARSYLFVPGNRPERFEKACAAGADAVIVDLEDAVPPKEKAAARVAVAAWLAPERPVLIRINSPGSEWFDDDLALCVAAGVAGIVVPKAERVEHLAQISARADTPVLPLIETAQGFWNAMALAQASHVQRLLFGSIDFQVDLGIVGDNEELLYFRSQLVLVSRLAGIAAPVDGVTADIDNSEQLRADSLRARRLGFGGKLCIHPKQIAQVNVCFAPSADELAWAQRVVEAAQAAGGAAVAVDGKMVDRPVLLKAQAILSEMQRKS
jgi:citrate lyase subunit beta/citryl-CoA lyase